MVQPLKTQQVIGLFGKIAGGKLLNWLDPCCDTFCLDIDTCLGISNSGDSSLFLNQVGGWIPVPSIVASNDLTGQTAAVSSVTTFTPTSNGQFSISGYITVTAVTAGTMLLQVTYTDETNTSRIQTFFPQGLTTSTIGAVGAVCFPPMTIRAKSGNPITVLTKAAGLVGFTYDVGGYIQRIN